MRISRDGFAVYSDNDIREWVIGQMREAGVTPIPKSRIADRKTGVVWDIEIDRIQNDDGLDVWY